MTNQLVKFVTNILDTIRSDGPLAGNSCMQERKSRVRTSDAYRNVWPDQIIATNSNSKRWIALHEGVHLIEVPVLQKVCNYPATAHLPFSIRLTLDELLS